jgi:hypothetical protein
MSNLPVPIGDYPGGEVLWLDEKQVKQIEAEARLKLSNALIAELSFAIDSFIISSGKTHKPLSRSKLRRTYRSLLKNLDSMQIFFSDASVPEAKEVRQKLESAIWFITTDKETLRKIPGLPREEFRRLLEADSNYPAVNTGRFRIDLIYLKAAAQAALDRIEREGKTQKSSKMTGSRKEVAFDRFLEDLEAIYRQATNVKGSFIDFLLAVHDTIPLKHRPRLPAGWGDESKDRRKSRK